MRDELVRRVTIDRQCVQVALVTDDKLLHRDGTTLGDFVGFLDTAFGQSTVAFDPGTGQVSVTSDVVGEAELSLAVTDQVNQEGRSDWATHFFAVTTNGTGPDTVTSSIETFDASGTSHILTFDFVRQEDGSWNMDATLPPEDGEVLNGTVAGITFNENGSILSPTSTPSALALRLPSTML